MVSQRPARFPCWSATDVILTIDMPIGGETAIDYSPGPQPGGREPAPGRLALVQAFVNSNYDLEHDHGADLLADPAALRKWLAARGLIRARERVSSADLAGALAMREGLRALAVANNGGSLEERAMAELATVARRAPLAVRLAGGEAELS